MKQIFQKTIALIGLLAVSHANAAEDFGHFEKKIRPLLVEHCYECHTADKAKGGLALDSRMGIIKGGDSGPALVPGKPDQSLLIKAVRHTDPHIKMPKKGGKLKDSQIHDLEQWVANGAPDPRTETTQALSPQEKLKQDGQAHWAFKPISTPTPPVVKQTSWPANEVDHFILGKLEEKNLTPAPRADKPTLLRRLSIKLTGLPPTQDELNTFLKDDSKEAYGKMVNHYLDSPAFGERWGRHWLDVARYGDTKGYLAGGQERRFPFSYTYRDYVIRSFNEDLPFDRFILEQLAADALELGEDKRPMAALGFLTLGRRFLGNGQDIIDDRIDVVTRGLMGLTVACARCHDHKFDPVPTEDYYSLYGIFQSSKEPDDLPLLGVQPPKELHEAYLAAKAEKQKKLEEFEAKELVKERAKVRERTGDYLLMVHDAKGIEDRRAQIKETQKRKLIPGVAARWLEGLKALENKHHPVLSVWVELEAAPKDAFKNTFEEKLAAWKAATGEKRINPILMSRLEEKKPDSLKSLATLFNEVFKGIEGEWQKATKKDAALKAFADADKEELRQVLYAEASPANVPESLNNELLAAARPRIRNLQADIDRVDATHEGAPPRAMALVDVPKPSDSRVFIRGSSGNRGDVAPRRFLDILSEGERPKYSQGSGRLELAKDIISKDNPLTARVWVNRVWLHLFGEAIVRTPSDFGLQSDAPSHPELLDHLAGEFIRNGWSTKKLIQELVTSATWQQSSTVSPDKEKAGIAADPSNFLLWRMNRSRLDLEAMRDSILFTSGKLDRKMGGLPVALDTEPYSTRRTVYGFVERQNLPSLFRTFDFANPETSNARRFTTSVPQQSLFLMNSPFMLEQAQTLAHRPEVENAGSNESKVEALFQRVFLREPSEGELKEAAAFLSKPAPDNSDALLHNPWSYGYGGVNEDASKVTSFTHLPKLVKGIWQGGPNRPDPKLGYTSLDDDGGHPGSGKDRMVIRRWTAPVSGKIQVNGVLRHASDKGDGVRGRIISSRTGLLSEGQVLNKAESLAVKPIEVSKGETIDFIVDEVGNTSFDSFTWAPKIEYLATEAQVPKRLFMAKTDFELSEDADLALSRITTLAQALLMSNEFMFVD